MFGRIWNFVKRHKRKVIFTGAVVGGGVLLWKYAQRKFHEFEEVETAECLAHAKRQHHFDSNQRTCNMTVLSMIPNLREAIIQLLNTEDITEQLKNNPANKVELWEELKVKSILRIAVVVYGCTMMSLLLRVQLNIIGGYLYLDTLVNKNGTTKQMVAAPPEVQELYLSLIKYFFNNGLKEMVVLIEDVVQKEVSSISLKEKMSVHNIQALFHNIRERIETGRENSPLSFPTLPLCKYFLPHETPTDPDLAGQEDQMYERLVSETRDVLESSDFNSVLHLSLDRGFSKLMDNIADHFKQQQQILGTTSSFVELSLPLAKLVPVVNGLLHKMCSDTPNPLIQELLLLDQTKNLAANIYEAFSQEEEDDSDDGSDGSSDV